MASSRASPIGCRILGLVVLDPPYMLDSRGSRQAVDPAEAPLGGQAGDGDEEVERVVPEGRGPGLGDRGVLRGEAGDERVEAVAVDDLAAGLLRRGLEVVAVGLQPGELVGGGLGGPAGLALADGAAVGGGRGGDDPIGAGLLGDVGGRVGPGLAAVGLGVEGQSRRRRAGRS